MNFDFDTPVNRRGTDCVKWDECRYTDELPLWVADMDFQVAPAIREALIRRAEHGVFGYSFPGNDYYESIDKWFTRRHSWKIPKEQVIYTTGVVPAISAVIKALTRPGDGVVIMTPVYTCFFSSIRNNDCHVVESPLRLKGRLYEIDFEDLEEKLRRESSRILLFCNPHNPGGRVWTAEELKKIDQLCNKYDVIILSDEIHCEMVMPGYHYTPFALVATGPYASMISSSKTFNTAGLHIANIVCPLADMREKINKAININETCDVGPFGIEALKAAYNEGEPWLNAMLDYVHKNYIFLKEFLTPLSQELEVMDLEGTYLAWIKVNNDGLPVAQLTEKLRNEAHIWLHPGTAYGKNGEGFIRINMATSRQTLSEALTRLVNWFKAH